MTSTMNNDPSTGAKPSPNEVKFDEVVKALLTENHAHSDLKQRLRRLVMEEAQKHPPTKVVYCASDGGFGYSKEFTAFLRSRSIKTHLRSGPALIQAISDYGRFICDKLPFILDDMRAVYTLQLERLLSSLSRHPMKQYLIMNKSTDVTEFNPDLVAEAKSFVVQMSDEQHPYQWRRDCLGNRQHSFNGPFIAFAEMHPDFWMADHCVNLGLFDGHSNFQVALRFAHTLLQGGDRARYHVESMEEQDAVIYEHIGLSGASTGYSLLYIEKIPAMVDYSITEHMDGSETVEY